MDVINSLRETYSSIYFSADSQLDYNHCHIGRFLAFSLVDFLNHDLSQSPPTRDPLQIDIPSSPHFEFSLLLSCCSSYGNFSLSKVNVWRILCKKFPIIKIIFPGTVPSLTQSYKYFPYKYFTLHHLA